MNCIINVSVGAWYPRAAARQYLSIIDTSPQYADKTMQWIDEYPRGCPDHGAVPYAFKPHAFKWAKDKEMDCVLWMDSAVWAQHNTQPIFDKIEKDGYFVLRNGWTTGNWSSDEQLAAFGYTRDQAYEIPHAMACVIGLNMNHKDGQTIYQEYFDNQHLFKGSWKNENNHLGTDERILGTRHDQTILSLIMHKHGFNYTNPQGWIDYNTGNAKSILLTQGL